MRQIIIIHGGTSFKTYKAYRQYLDTKVLNYEKLLYRPRWKEWLATQLPNDDVLYPSMPNKSNAVYSEWEIFFSKILKLVDHNLILIGHSLGAMFLMKYLNTHQLKVPALQVHLVAGGYDDESNEDLGSFKVESAKDVIKSAKEVHLWHSEDDPVVPFSELAKIQKDIPTATLHIFTNREHFSQQDTFPELLEAIQK